jgi:hypothetical protein
MLKIKNNIDLKELEKFGFIYATSGWNWLDDKQPTQIYIDNCGVIAISNRNAYSFWCDVPSVIFDLIQAGLVEKVN